MYSKLKKLLKWIIFKENSKIKSFYIQGFNLLYENSKNISVSKELDPFLHVLLVRLSKIQGLKVSGITISDDINNFSDNDIVITAKIKPPLIHKENKTVVLMVKKIECISLEELPHKHNVFKLDAGIIDEFFKGANTLYIKLNF